jgi:hypothetical protein
MQSFGIGIAQFELDMLAVALDCFAADAELARDLTGAVPSRDQRKNGFKPVWIADSSSTHAISSPDSAFIP